MTAGAAGASMETVHDVVVVAGGSSRRMGGVDKLALHDRTGRSLLDTAVAGALTTGASRVIVVGPPRALETGQDPADQDRVRWTQEDPPDGGPLAGLAAGLRETAADVVAVASADAPAAAEAIPTLVATTRPGTAAVLLDGGGRRTLCLAVGRDDALRALAGIGEPRDRSMRALFDGLEAIGVRVIEVVDTWGAADDVDTPGDAERLGWFD